jgi:transposase
MRQGSCGFALYLYLTGNGFTCIVTSPAMIPRRNNVRIKNDRRDALMLARLYRAAELTGIYVPEPEDEAIRDLTRARDDARVAQNAKPNNGSTAFCYGTILFIRARQNGTRPISIG